VEFKVETDVFSGPMDLLLYLVKKHEVDPTAVPIARITAEFLAYIDLLEELAVEQVGDFVELASVLLEIKSRALVPHAAPEDEPAVEPIREDLVRRLLEYRKFRDAAAVLEDRARQWELRFTRLPAARTPDGEQRPPIAIVDAQVWDLVGGLGRVLAKRERRRPRQIVHDDTPLEVHTERIERLLRERGRLAFVDLVDDDMERPRVIGIFLAVLELVRRGRLATLQDRLFGEIWLTAPEGTDPVPRPRLHDAP